MACDDHQRQAVHEERDGGNDGLFDAEGGVDAELADGGKRQVPDVRNHSNVERLFADAFVEVDLGAKEQSQGRLVRFDQTAGAPPQQIVAFGIDLRVGEPGLAIGRLIEGQSRDA